MEHFSICHMPEQRNCILTAVAVASAALQILVRLAALRAHSEVDAGLCPHAQRPAAATATVNVWTAAVEDSSSTQGQTDT